MKREFGLLRSLLGLLCLGLSCHGTLWAQEIEWIEQFGTTQFERAIDISVDSLGVYAVGWTQGALPGEVNAGSDDAFVRKYNPSGSELWTRQFGTASEDIAAAVSVSSSGVYISGTTRGSLPGQTSSGDRDSFVRKYDSSGSELWTRQFGTSGSDGAPGISSDSLYVYVAGLTFGAFVGETNSGSDDAYVRKYDSSGTVVWTRQFGTGGSDRAEDVYVESSGVYVVGNTLGALPSQTNAGAEDAYVRKYDESGTEIWTRQFGTASSDRAVGVVVDSSGVYAGGWTFGTFASQTSAGGRDAFVRKYDSDGAEVWTRQFGTIYDDEATDVSAEDLGIFVAGFTLGALPTQVNAGFEDAFVRKYDVSGSELWTSQFGTEFFDKAEAVDAGSSSVFVAGVTAGSLLCETNIGAEDAFVAFLSENQPPICDSDNDDVPDDQDECPDSNLTETVVIGNCDTGVSNTVLASGCTIMDLIQEAEESSTNHGKFVVAVIRLTNELRMDGVITLREQIRIIVCAARSEK